MCPAITTLRCSDLILLNISRDQWLILGIYVICAFVWFTTKHMIEWWKNLYVVYTLLMTIMACLILASVKLKQGAESHLPQFEFTYRYLIFLAPMGIIGAALAAKQLYDWAQKDFWLKINIVIGLAGLLILRILKSFVLILGLYK